MATKKPDRYEVCDTDAEGRPVTGIDYPPNRRAEAGQVVDDIPQSSLPWLLKQGYVRKAQPRKATKKAQPRKATKKAQPRKATKKAAN